MSDNPNAPANDSVPILVTLDDVMARLNLLRVDVDEILETHRKILTIVQDIAPEIMPLVEGLQRNPMVQMLTGSAKK